MAFDDRDRECMRRALDLAAHGLFTATPNPRVGCVLVRDGRVIGEGWHERAGEAHAEIRALAGAQARADGHRWRARSCAILTGIGTVLQDDPRLTVREVETSRQPLKVIVDRHGQLPAHARLLDGGEVIVVSAGMPQGAWPGNVQHVRLPGPDGRVDLAAMLMLLAERGVNELHVEAGAKLNGALLAAGLVDVLLFYLSPCLLC